jgi:predicted metal-dependent hydrolase
MLTNEDGKRMLRSKAAAWATRLKVEIKTVRIQPMRRKWGSCSTTGTITLATDLIEAPPEFQDFVIAHELLHLRVPNHGKLFKALMTIYVPEWRRYEIAKDDRRGGR